MMIFRRNEYDFIKEALPQIDDGSYQLLLKNEPPKPDYSIRKSTTEVAYVEVTQISDSDKKAETKNYNKIFICLEVQSKLEKWAAGRGHIRVMIIFKTIPRLSKRKNLIDFLHKYVLSLEPYSISVKSPHPDVEYLFVDIASNAKDSLMVTSSYEYIPAEYLQKRLQNKITEKDQIKYELTGSSEAWLIVSLNDHYSTIDDAKTVAGTKYTFSRFNRVFLEADYNPPAQNYPLFELRKQSE